MQTMKARRPGPALRVHDTKVCPVEVLLGDEWQRVFYTQAGMSRSLQGALRKAQVSVGRRLGDVRRALGAGWVIHGDCVEVMRAMPEASVDAIVTDPPYLIGFMGRDWDRVEQHAAVEWHERWAREAIRVLKPGGHLLAFGGARTYAWLTVGLAEAGFEIRDTLCWLYGQGFAKSWNFGTQYGGEWCQCDPVPYNHAGDAPSPTCSSCGGLKPVYKGFGTGLKPAHEPIVVARKPLAGTVAANVLQHGGRA
jgi:DNA methylase